MPKTDHDTELAWLFETFDHQRWSVACREMQVRIVRGDTAKAHDVLDAFTRFTGYTKATLASSVGSVLPVRIANELEDAGYTKLQAIDRVSDAQLLTELSNFAETSLAPSATVLPESNAASCSSNTKKTPSS